MISIKKVSIFCALFLISFSLFSYSPSKKAFFKLLYKACNSSRQLIWGDNFHIVEKGKLYRSSQLSPEKLQTYIDEYGIKTIINLRHNDEFGSDGIMEKEKAHAAKNSVLFYNIPMDAYSLTPKEQIEELLMLYLVAPKPILIHCWAGADRTGEAAAFWVLLNDYLYSKNDKHSSIAKALEQLTLSRGHFRIIFPNKYYLISHFFEIYPDVIENVVKMVRGGFSFLDMQKSYKEGMPLQILSREMG